MIKKNKMSGPKTLPRGTPINMYQLEQIFY